MPQILTPETVSQKPVINDPKRRGFILITHTLMIGITIGFVGLAVDAGTMYVIKGRLSSAVDAAALAAGRSLNLGNTLSAAQAAAQTTATQFFNANFPAGYLGAGTPTLTIPLPVDETDANGNPSGIIDIAVSASVPAPTYFIRVLNAIPLMSAPNSVIVAATGTATRRGTVMMLVLDISSSMNQTDVNGSTACLDMTNAARTFIKHFSPYDTVGAITFDWTATLIYKPVNTFLDGTLDAALAGITCGNNTNTVSGLELAYRQIQAVNLQLAYNSIVLFTDGSPNGISAQFKVFGSGGKTSDNRWGAAATTPNPPTQTGAMIYGRPTSCANGGTDGKTDSTGALENGICVGMPVLGCTITTITGTITQGGNQDPFGGTTSGVFTPISTTNYPGGDAAPVYDASGPCSNGASPMRQLIAYIPDTDLYGNSTHGVVATNFTTPSPSICSTGLCNGMVSKDYWLYQVNSENNTTYVPAAKNTGGLWSGFSIGSGSNFFQATNAYPGYFRPDQPNSIVAASMNATMAEAYRIRSDAATGPSKLFHTVINTIYLTGNGSDSVDHEFLPIVANYQWIPALPYDANYNPNNNPNLYANPAFQTSQEQGKYLVTADPTQLQNLFDQLASEVLRLSH
jgi:Flp pilus assembly protein TadG